MDSAEKDGRFAACLTGLLAMAVLLALPLASWGQEEKAGRSTVKADGDEGVLLNAGAILTTSAEAQALRGSVGSFDGKRLHLVQFAGPIRPAWYAALEATGAEVVQYIPSFAYLVYGDASALSRVQKLDAVRWDGAYLDQYKIQSGAREATRARLGLPADKDAFAIQLVRDPEANAETAKLVERLAVEPVRQQYTILKYQNLVVTLPVAAVREIASRPDVVSIDRYVTPELQGERQDQIVSGHLTGNEPTPGDYLGYLASKGFTQAQFTASGFVVDVSDSGIDNGTTTPNHFGLRVEGSLANAGRVQYNRLEGTPHAGSTIQGCDGHGNLNSHIVAGYVPDPSTLPVPSAHADGSAYRYGLGVAPFVKVGSSVIFDPASFTDPDYPDLQSRAYNDNARISTNSWGADTGGAYTTDAQAYDALVRDAQPTGSAYAAAGNQEMVIVFSAGNAGSGANTIGSPAVAKNVIAVGASEGVQAFGGADNCGVGDISADSANDIVWFSSRGPTDDGRFKPEIVAPGSHISGGVFQLAATVAGTGAAGTCFDGSGVCGGPSASNFFPTTQQFYTASSGTSHSAPAVAGGAALVRQHFINGALTPPSPAMTKAVLVNSARYMTGSEANDTLPSNNQGMGMMNLETHFSQLAAPRLLYDQHAVDMFTASGQERAVTGTVADSGQPFRVTLAWTDAPGSTSGNSYVNNLDLEVTVGGNTYLGNVFSGASSTTGGSADPRNNVESVFLPAGVSGVFSVRVIATNIAGDGVPNVGGALDQDYALIISNATETSMPVITAGSATLLAESCGTGNGVLDPGETVTMSLCLQNVGSADTGSVVGTLQATGGVTSPSAPQPYGVLTAGGPAVCQSFDFVVDSLTCGASVTTTVQVQDGATDRGNAVWVFPTGTPAVAFEEDFDGVTAPALPAGWTTTSESGADAWTTVTSNADTAPNAAFINDPATVSLTSLVSPAIAVPTTTSPIVLTFRHYYNLEEYAGTTTAWDGGVLELSIGGGAFQDILAAGGSFEQGGYTHTISTGFSNPLGGRQAWSGSSGGFITTVVDLPAAASGQTVQLRWRRGSDSMISMPGWYVDSIDIQAGSECCTFVPFPPTITSFAPTNGPVGTSVSIAGTSFLGANTVTFNGTSASFSVNSATSITAAVPAGATTGPISVTTPGGAGTSASDFTVMASLPPTITGFAPTSGVVGISVAITGTNFTGASVVAFNGTSASYTVHSNALIMATVPSGATTGPISVTTPGGTATSASSFTVTGSPSPIHLYLCNDFEELCTSPETSGMTRSWSYPAGFTVPWTGTDVLSGDISGTSYTFHIYAASNGTTSFRADLRINGDIVATTTFSASSTDYSLKESTVTGIDPTLIGTSTVRLEITNTGGSTGGVLYGDFGADDSYVVLPPNAPVTPTVTGFTPTSGPVGTSVAITGTDFTGATTVMFNGTSAGFSVDSSTSITATVPTGATTGPISVTVPTGTGTSASSFTVIPAPTITGFTPTSGPVGTSVAITGTSFTGATAVAFNGTSASYTVNSAISIAATVPSGATTGPISVTTPGGTVTSASGFTVIPAPTITGFTPTSGPVGTSVAITGTDFTGATAVAFNGTSATYTVNSASSITATVPSGATTGPISVTTPGGTASSAESFTVTDFTIGAGLTGFCQGSVAWGDHDNDGDLDILVSGSASSGQISQVYRNDAGVFTDIGAGLTGVFLGSVAWGDYDNDGDLDILLTGDSGSGLVSQVYRNDAGVFTDLGAGLTGVDWSSAAWGDYDNDGDLDILLTGDSGSGFVSQVYRNDAGVFTDIGAGLTGVEYSSVAWGDYDSDGDLDILLTGDSGSGLVSQVYRNDAGVFTEVGAGLTGVAFSSVAWGDYDNDGDLDILLTGQSGSGFVSEVYRNDAGVFTGIGAGLPGVAFGSAAWGDHDNDGDLDILLTGYSLIGVGYEGIARVYRNDAGVFSDIEAGLTGVWWSSVAWGDYDNDGDVDIAIAGAGGVGTMAAVYRNHVTTTNTVPKAPTGLATGGGGDSVTLSWAAASDGQTPAAGLTYNVRVGTSSGSGDIEAPMAAADGYRRIPALGNAQQGTSAVLRSLPVGAYYWSVQAVDTAFKGSAFASEGTFTVSPPPTITGFTPTSGLVGTSVAITGTDFTGATDVAFNGTSASYTVGSASSITATVPSGATTGPISVTTLDGTATSAADFTVVALCTSFTISPASVSVPHTADSQVVTITGVPAGCGGGEWTTAGNGSWITISPASGTGSGSATVSWDENPGFARSGEATIAGETFTVVQGSPNTDYFTLTPCRVVNTRTTTPLVFGTPETFPISGECGVPATATAAAFNMTVVDPTAMGNCRLYPDPSQMPQVSTINYSAGQTRGNNAIVPLLSPDGTVTVRCVGAAPGTIDVILDVFGYFDVTGGGD